MERHTPLFYARRIGQTIMAIGVQILNLQLQRKFQRCPQSVWYDSGIQSNMSEFPHSEACPTTKDWLRLCGQPFLEIN